LPPPPSLLPQAAKKRGKTPPASEPAAAKQHAQEQQQQQQQQQQQGPAAPLNPFFLPKAKRDVAAGAAGGKARSPAAVGLQLAPPPLGASGKALRPPLAPVHVLQSGGAAPGAGHSAAAAAAGGGAVEVLEIDMDEAAGAAPAAPAAAEAAPEQQAAQLPPYPGTTCLLLQPNCVQGLPASGPRFLLPAPQGALSLLPGPAAAPAAPAAPAAAPEAQAPAAAAAAHGLPPVLQQLLQLQLQQQADAVGALPGEAELLDLPQPAELAAQLLQALAAYRCAPPPPVLPRTLGCARLRLRCRCLGRAPDGPGRASPAAQGHGAAQLRRGRRRAELPGLDG
jgi:hypothetical protein